MTTTTTDGDRPVLDAVADAHGAELVDLRRLGVEPTTSGAINGYLVTLRFPDGRCERHHLYVETAPTDDGREGVLRLRGADGDTRDVWLYPRDPALPALAAVAHPEGARVLLSRLGFTTPGLPEVTVLSYRPGRRAAARVRTGGATIYLKVVAPRHARTIFERHARWRDAGVPVPAATAWSADGLVALEPLPGVPAADALPRIPDAARFAAELERLRGSIARVASPEPARASLARRLDWYRVQLERRHPESADRVRDVVDAIARRRDGAVTPEHVTVHGDLHLSQVFVDADQPTVPTGILDLDTGGLGDPADDDAALWAHLAATAVREAGDTAVASSALAMLRAVDSGRPRDPARRERASAVAATHLLGHALGGALPLADALRLAADRVADPDESPLIPVSIASHRPSGS